MEFLKTGPYLTVLVYECVLVIKKISSKNKFKLDNSIGSV